MNVTINVSGLDTLGSNLTQWLADKLAQTDQAIQTAGINTEAGAKQRAPVDTGRFRAGYQYENVGSCQCQVGNPVEYGPDLEFGHLTRSGSFVPPQPSLFPAYADASAQLDDDLKTIWQS